MLSAIGLMICLCLLLDIVRRIVAYRRLRHVPGPFWASISRIYLFRVLRGRVGMHKELTKVQDKYGGWEDILDPDTSRWSPVESVLTTDSKGSLTRIGPNQVLTDDPELIRRMNAPRSPFRRSDWYLGMKFSPDSDNIVSTKDEAVHNDLRSKMVSVYTVKEFPRMERNIDKHVLNLIDLIERKYLSVDSVVKPLDLALTAQYFTLDVISNLAFGKAFGDLTRDEDVYGLIQTSQNAINIVAVVTLWPVSFHVMAKLSSLAPSLMKNGVQDIVALAKDVVSQRLGEGKEGEQDILGSFMRHGMTPQQLVSEATIQILAGNDTTATAIRTTLLHIITNPQIYHRLQREIDQAEKQNLLSHPVATDAEARQLPYLQACIKEGLRLYPPAVGLFEKEVPPEGAQVGTTLLPGGTRVGFNLWRIMHNKAVFGQDANVYRPERWSEETDEEKLRHMERDQALIFGSGRFSCVGKPVALIELNKFLVELLRRYDVTIMDPANPWDCRLLGLWWQRHMFVKVTKRELKE